LNKLFFISRFLYFCFFNKCCNDII